MKLYTDQKPEDCFDCPLEYTKWYDDDEWSEPVNTCPLPRSCCGCPLIPLKDKSLIDSLEYDYCMRIITADQAQNILNSKGVDYNFKNITDSIREEKHKNGTIRN